MALFEPSLVPLATFQPSQAPKRWTFDSMDDMVELQDEPEMYQASSQVSRLDDKHCKQPCCACAAKLVHSAAILSSCLQHSSLFKRTTTYQSAALLSCVVHSACAHC